MSLARDRLENCETLNASIKSSFLYAKKYVLHSVVGAYSSEASRVWSRGNYGSVREHFTKCVDHELPNDWVTRWRANKLPPSDATTFVFENSPDRAPNPIAYFSRTELWPKDDEFGLTIPWIPSHGDLNAKNVLCPSVQRSLALSMATGSEHALVKFGQAMLKHLSFIDMPFCREAPFTFDPAFLVTWLSVLLPPFDARVQQDVALRSFRAIIEVIRTENEPLDVPSDGAKFVECFSLVFRGPIEAQPRMVEDIKKSVLSSLAAAALWQAIRVGSNSAVESGKRLEAISLLCLSSLALQELLGDHVVRGLVNQDFPLEAMPGHQPLRPRTSAASHLAELFIATRGRQNLLVVLGRQCDELFKLPDDAALEGISKLESTELLDLINRKVATEAV